MSLYADLNFEASKLANLKGVFRSLKEADSILAHINEDMQMIPRYVGLRVYLLNYCGKTSDARRVLDDYRYQLYMMGTRKIGKYSILEEIHCYYPYHEANLDFWIEKPKQMISVLTSYETILEQKETEVFFLKKSKKVRKIGQITAFQEENIMIKILSVCHGKVSPKRQRTSIYNGFNHLSR